MPKAIILAGGVGSRLWPLSREAYPKQFIQFFDGKSLFQKTVERLLPIFGPNNLLVSTGEPYKFIVKNQLDEMKLEVSKDQILVEPEAKSTLPAVLLAMHRFGSGEYGVFPSDHTMADDGGLRQSIEAAQNIVSEYIISFGIVPNWPHTGYGYIRPGEQLFSGYRVKEFVEKPDFETAKKYVESGYYWNAGMMYTNLKNFKMEVEKYSPEHLLVLDDGEAAYKKVSNQTMEYGVFEKTNLAAVIPIKSYWNDLGSFSSFFDVLNKNGGSVATNTEVLDFGAKNSLVISEESKLVGLIDVKDLVVVDTRDALLIGSKNSSEKVKKIFNTLRDKGDLRAKQHTTVYRPWGFFTLMEGNSKYKVKKVVIYPGKRMTLHRHMNRTEHWVIAKGVAEIKLDDKRMYLKSGESVYVPKGASHMLKNPSELPLEMIEVQIGNYLDESDVEVIGKDHVEDL
ncbi:MAG: mannose-1-phosphate guanylyltransferase/mannose-6-phosphate isomerase [Candidatus Altiarchaeota archaeon]|nr:mannose-1-phosphate guanylyltransferase/mannose-6-phosphate isomerase [Candidatus Altiarchaeota archaeon]